MIRNLAVNKSLLRSLKSRMALLGWPADVLLSPEKRFSVGVRLHLPQQFQALVVQLLGNPAQCLCILLGQAREGVRNLGGSGPQLHGFLPFAARFFVIAWCAIRRMALILMNPVASAWLKTVSFSNVAKSVR